MIVVIYKAVWLKWRLELNNILVCSFTFRKHKMPHFTPCFPPLPQSLLSLPGHKGKGEGQLSRSGSISWLTDTSVASEPSQPWDLDANLCSFWLCVRKLARNYLFQTKLAEFWLSKQKPLSQLNYKTISSPYFECLKAPVVPYLPLKQ